MSEEEPTFPVVQKSQIPNWCEHSVEKINMLLPLAFTLMYNQKGRYQIGVLSMTDHQKGEKLIVRPETWVHPTGVTVDDRKELAAMYKQFKAAHVFVHAVSSHSGEVTPAAAVKFQHCQLFDILDSLVHMTE